MGTATSNMQSTQWRLDGLQAILQMPQLSAAVDVLRPTRGLGELSFKGQPRPEMQLLCVDFVGSESLAASEIDDCYERCDDLVATYAQTAQRVFRTQIYWRPAERSGVGTAIELVASVQTSLLDSRPVLTTGSRLRASAVFRLTSADEVAFEPVSLQAEAPLRFDNRQPGCFVARIDEQLSYAEMVHPLDARETSVAITAQSDGPRLELRHRLFARPLEKGVILRSRVLGLLLPRQDDLQVAARQYQVFAAAEPPLTT